ncbi:MAG: AraC family transcriptional regulator [Mucilaginibacter sp.]|nr:AraC family transcriptional regulator [Mucilaginibacter sp.]
MSENLCFERVKIPDFFVAGIAVNTINQDGRSQKDIGDLWTRFTTENMIEKIAGKLSQDIYCVYTDYESDHTGWYTAVLGCRVENADNVPEDFFTALVPTSDYQIYTPQGKFPESVANTWRQIWQTDINRKYSADYDRYKAGARSFEETEVEVYLSVV